jgi:dCTP deaminase
MDKQICDKILVDSELEEWAVSKEWGEKGGIYKNYSGQCLHGDSYDIRAGDLIIIGQVDGRKYIALKDRKEVFIEPFQSASVQSFERIKIPTDMCGDLWIRNALQHEGLAYTGGGIDPGYWGHFYIKIHNVGPRKVAIKYGQPIASTRLIKLHQHVKKPYTESEITEPRPEQLPPLPSRVVYDWLDLSKKVDNLRSDIDNIKSIHDKLVVGSIAGLVIGSMLILIDLILRLSLN